MKRFKEFVNEGISSITSTSIYSLAKLSMPSLFSKMNSNSRLIRESNSAFQNIQILNSQIMLLAALLVRQRGNEKMQEFLENYQEDDSIERLKVNSLFEQVKTES